MWTAVYMATGLANAEKIQATLKQEGFLVKLKYFAKEGEEEIYEVLVPEFEAEDVQQAMLEIGII